MEKEFYFISGLPRSGNGLISAILNQNPRFYSGLSSPMVEVIASTENAFSSSMDFPVKKEPITKQILKSILVQYYSDRKEDVIFDVNASWLNNISSIRDVLDLKPRIICPVRSNDAILTSFISAINEKSCLSSHGKLNFIDEVLVKNNVQINDRNRCEYLAGNGPLGEALGKLKQILTDGMDSCIHIVEYDDLIEYPHETMNLIYEFLGEEPYEHDFDNIKSEYADTDIVKYGIQDITKIRSMLKSTSQDPKKILPEEVYNMCKGTEFWRDDE